MRALQPQLQPGLARSSWSGYRSGQQAPHKIYATPPPETPGQLVTSAAQCRHSTSAAVLSRLPSTAALTVRCSSSSSAVLSVSEYGDVYPVSRNSAEEQLTSDSITSGYVFSPLPSLSDEYATLEFRAFAAQRQRLQQRITEAAQQPRTRRAAKPLPVLSVANREQKEEWLQQLASPDAELDSLCSHVPHGVKGQAMLDELQQRGVSVVRAVWFIRIVYRNSVSDAARVRISCQQRGRLWTDDAKRHIDGLLQDIAAAHRPQQRHTASSLAALSSLTSRLHYASRVLQLSFREGLVSRLRWLDWLLEQSVSTVSALLSLPSVLPVTTAASNAQPAIAFASSFSQWSGRASQLLLLLSPYLPAFACSRLHAFRLFVCLSTMTGKLRAMQQIAEERQSRQRMLTCCSDVAAAITAALPCAEHWDELLTAEPAKLSTALTGGGATGSTAGGEMSAAELLVLLEDFAGKGEGKEKLVRGLHCSCSLPPERQRGGVELLHVLMEWSVHPHYRQHHNSVAAAFSLIAAVSCHHQRAASPQHAPPALHASFSPAQSYACLLPPAASSPSPLLAAITASVHRFLLLFPSLSCFSFPSSQRRLLQLLSHLLSVGLLDYTAYLRHVLCHRLTDGEPALSRFSRLLLSYLPLPHSSPSSHRQLRRIALHGMGRRPGSGSWLHWQAMAVLLQRMPAMQEGGKLQDMWSEERWACMQRCSSRSDVEMQMRNAAAAFPLLAACIDSSSGFLTPPSVVQFLHALPFSLSSRLLSALLERFLAFLSASLPALQPATCSPLRLYLERSLHCLLFLLESSPHFPLLSSFLLHALQLPAVHELQLADSCLAVCRRHFLVLAVTDQLPGLQAVLAAALRRQPELVAAEVYLEQAALPAAFTQQLRSEVLERWQPRAVLVAPPSPLRPPLLTAERAAAEMERYRTGQSDLCATLSWLQAQGLTAATVQIMQREVLRHVIIAAWAGAKTASAYSASAPHLQSAVMRVRLSELCAMLRQLTLINAGLGRERGNAVDGQLSPVLEICSALSQCHDAAWQEEDSRGAAREGLRLFMERWRLQQAAGEAVAAERARMTDHDDSEDERMWRLSLRLRFGLSVFLVMAVSRQTLRLGRLVRRCCDELDGDQHRPNAFLLQLIAALFGSSTTADRELWDIDARRWDMTVYAEGKDVFPLLQCLLSLPAAQSTTAAAAALSAVSSNLPFLQSCFHHLPSFVSQLLELREAGDRVALFSHIDSCLRPALPASAPMPATEASWWTAATGLDGMEGLDMRMLQDVLRIRRDWRRRWGAERGEDEHNAISALQLGTETAAASLQSPQSLQSLLSSLSLWSLPFLHLQLQLAMSASGAAQAGRAAFLSSLLQAAVSSSDDSASLALILLRLLSLTDSAVCEFVVDGVASHLKLRVDRLTAALTTTGAAAPSATDDLPAALLSTVRAAAAADDTGDAEDEDEKLPQQLSSLLSALSDCPHFSSAQRAAFARRVVAHLTALAQAASASSLSLVAANCSARFLSAAHCCRLLLLPLLPHVDSGTKAAELDALLKAALSLLVFPLSSLSSSPACPHFTAFLQLLCLAADQLRWMDPILATFLPLTAAASSSAAAAQRGSCARSDNALFDLHTAFLAAIRQRPLPPDFATAIARCVPSAQGGALTDELLYILPAAIAPATASASAAASAAASSSSPSAAAAAARQPIDPWCVLESCGGGPLVDAVWESSQAARSAAS